MLHVSAINLLLSTESVFDEVFDEIQFIGLKGELVFLRIIVRKGILNARIVGQRRVLPLN